MSTNKRRVVISLIFASLLINCNTDPYRIVSLTDASLSNNDGSESSTNYYDLYVPEPRPDIVLPDIGYDACAVLPEVCNGVDDNCNNQIDEGFDKIGDPRYCDNCKGCKHLLNKNAFPGCINGSCVIASCAGGFLDINGLVSDGCEYQCTPTGVEACDGVDNDCNGKKDDGLSAGQQLCNFQGACNGSTLVCAGTQGWKCSYGTDVELQLCTKDEDCGGTNKCINNVCLNVIILEETKCDGKDNDCDGVVDDPWKNSTWPNSLGKECEVDDPPLKGICHRIGEYKCDATQTKVTCQLKTGGALPTAEICNGLDDNCDGEIDNNVTDEQWVTVSASVPFMIFKYEATRPDATSLSAGIVSTGQPCSVPNRLPWTNVTKENAKQACEYANSRLCTVEEWEIACKGSVPTTFPYGNTFDPDQCNGKAYDIDGSTPGNQDGPLTVEKPTNCTSIWVTGGGASEEILNMSGNVKEWVVSNYISGTPTGYEIKGGAYDTPSVSTFGVGLSCDYDLPAPTTTLQLPTLGFRCCK